MKLLDWIHEDKMNYSYLSSNKNAVHILEYHLDKVNWARLSLNPNAIHILEQHLDKVNWENLSLNSNACHILEQHLDKVNWDYSAIDLIELYYDEDDICWTTLSSTNINEMDTLRFYIEKVDWLKIWQNPSIFKYDYKYMKETIDVFK